MDSNSSDKNVSLPAGVHLRRLTADQVRRIDELLVTVGDYGEVHLIVQRGELRYINKVESYKAWNDHQNNK
jgi:hypothetical protein